MGRDRRASRVSSRLIRIRQDFRTSLAREGVRSGSPAFRAVARTIRALANAASLPTSRDLKGLAPIESAVSTWADARLVPRSGGLVVWYRANEHVLELLAVSRLKQ